MTDLIVVLWPIRLDFFLLIWLALLLYDLAKHAAIWGYKKYFQERAP